MDPVAKRFLFTEDSLSPITMITPTVANVQVDWVETIDTHILKVDVPGFRREDIQLKVVDGYILQISGEQKREVVEGKWHSLERPRGPFFRQFKLPDRVQADEIRAFDENGVLTIVVPKKPVARKIDIFSKL
eukprot:c53316_g1_i1 orf=200-595(+)